MSKEKNNHCDYNSFKRARYFHGQLLTDREFREEQLYHNEKRKLHNRMLHGWGVVCGLEIVPKEGATVTVKTGMALDCAGNEIYLDKPYDLNLPEIIKRCRPEPAKADICAETEANAEEKKWYVVVRYKEVPTDPVPVYAPGGGCEEKVCDYSRTREGYCIELIRADAMTLPCPGVLPEEGACEEDLNAEEKRAFLCEALLMPCPDNCCGEEGVVLGSITLPEGVIGKETVITGEMINNWDCRKYVMSFGLLQHWMTKLAPREVPLDAIVNYAMLAGACGNVQSAAEAFDDICREEEVEAEEKTKVPTLTGKSHEAALEMIKEARLTQGSVTRRVSQATPGTVIEQNPESGSEVAIHTAVDLVIASKELIVPSRPVEEIDGIGPVYANKLETIGVKTVRDLAEAEPKKVAEVLELSDDRVRDFIVKAKKMAG